MMNTSSPYYTKIALTGNLWSSDRQIPSAFHTTLRDDVPNFYDVPIVLEMDTGTSNYSLMKFAVSVMDDTIPSTKWNWATFVHDDKFYWYHRDKNILTRRSMKFSPSVQLEEFTNVT